MAWAQMQLSGNRHVLVPQPVHSSWWSLSRAVTQSSRRCQGHRKPATSREGREPQGSPSRTPLVFGIFSGQRRRSCCSRSICLNTLLNGTRLVGIPTGSRTCRSGCSGIEAVAWWRGPWPRCSLRSQTPTVTGGGIVSCLWTLCPARLSLRDAEESHPLPQGRWLPSFFSTMPRARHW